ncbi:MAG: Crp/Fnr family transcriptional regulator [Clostridium sp.]|nr:Crp/Fnr family transcriptional regulator [Clostridium sp.]
MNETIRDIPAILETSYPFWERLTSLQKDRMAACSYIRTYGSGQFIHSRTEECLGALLVLKGQIRTYIQSEEGREVTLFRLGKDEICTLSASCMMQEITFDIYIEALEETTLLVTSAACIRKVMEESIYAESYIYRLTAERFSDVMWSMGQLLFTSLDKRLAAYLADEQVKSHTGSISTTHGQIAKNLGTAREVVSRTLKFFEKEGILSLGRGTIKILDMKKLRELLL